MIPIGTEVKITDDCASKYSEAWVASIRNKKAVVVSCRLIKLSAKELAEKAPKFYTMYRIAYGPRDFYPLLSMMVQIDDHKYLVSQFQFEPLTPIEL